MNITKWIPGILIAGALVLAGCGKSQPQGPQPMQINGVKVDMPKLQEAFTTDNQQLPDSINKARMAIRYGKFTEAMMELDKLAASSGLTDAQKTVVNDVIGQLKQVIAKAPANPAP